MVLKPTIYNFNLDLSGLERRRIDSLNLSVALHPSVTVIDDTRRTGLLLKVWRAQLRGYPATESS